VVSGLDRVPVCLAQRDEVEVLLELRERQLCGKGDGLEREVSDGLQLGDHGRELGSRGRPVDPADAHLDGMDLAAADDPHQRISGLLLRRGWTRSIGICPRCRSVGRRSSLPVVVERGVRADRGP